MKIEKRYYTANEVIEIIKDKWSKGPDVVNEFVEFIEGIKMKRDERDKLNNSDEAGLLYSAYDDHYE